MRRRLCGETWAIASIPASASLRLASLTALSSRACTLRGICRECLPLRSRLTNTGSPGAVRGLLARQVANSSCNPTGMSTSRPSPATVLDSRTTIVPVERLTLHQFRAVASPIRKPAPASVATIAAGRGLPRQSGSSVARPQHEFGAARCPSAFAACPAHDSSVSAHTPPLRRESAPASSMPYPRLAFVRPIDRMNSITDATFRPARTWSDPECRFRQPAARLKSPAGRLGLCLPVTAGRQTSVVRAARSTFGREIQGTAQLPILIVLMNPVLKSRLGLRGRLSQR